MKRCKDCGVEKPLTEFYKMGRGRQYHSPRCKPCDAAYHKERARIKREKIGCSHLWTIHINYMECRRCGKKESFGGS